LLQVVSVPEIPCTEEDAIPTVLVTEGYTSSFVDYGDPLERKYPGPPSPPRVALGANANTQVSLTVSGLSSDVHIHWPVEVIAQNNTSVLDLISQSADGFSATYIYGTVNQFESDELAEVFAIRLRPENFRFSGTDELSGVVSVQAQLLPPPFPENIRPRFDHPLSPEQGLTFFLVKRCAPAAGPVGSIEIRATVDEQDWTGGLHVHIAGPAPLNSSIAPQTIEDLPVGNYGVTYLSGGPGGAELEDITPTSIQTMGVNSTIEFTFNFTGPTFAVLQLTANPQPVCPAANATVTTFLVTNPTGDTQIIPAGAALEFTFSSPLVELPTASGFEGATVTSSMSSVKYEFPEAVTLPPSSALTFSGTVLDLSGVPDGQDVTVMLTGIPSEAVQLASNQITVATTDLEVCTPPPTFVSAGITNGASFESGMSAGSIATLFGDNLTTAAGIVLADAIPLPTEIDGASVTVNGMEAPLFAVANVGGQEQINFQVPWEAAGEETVTVIVTKEGEASEPVEAGLLAVFPGIFTTDGTIGAILHEDGVTLVTPSSPASPGEVVTIYATGLGPVSATPATGEAALVEPLSITAFDPVVTVGGMQAIVEFSGLAPNFVGLYQVNVRLPQGLAPGTHNIVLQVNSQASKPATIAIQ
jgi:uncharacterized protein (TIGR03437 family)